MKLSDAQRRMLLNAKGFVATVSRQAELAKDMVLAHQLSDIAAELHTIMQNPVKERRPAVVIPLSWRET